ncbi:MAG: hypothetical protein JJ899_06905 [Alphaproteobacteria bacterium]|nr:hypothetical protein [Alphaproteobacteria bacterium]
MRAGKDSSAEKPKKKGKKRLLLILLVLLVAGGGAAGYKFVLAAPDPALAEAGAPEPEPQPVAPGELIYINLDPLFVPFSTAEGAHHKIVVTLALEVDRAEHADEHVRAVMPRLREAYVRALTSRPFPGTADGTIETVYLKNRVRAENNRILGIGVVHDVLVRDIRVVAG